jgi:hypothetical protein
LLLKLHILHNHFDFHPENTRALSDKHSECFIKIFPKWKTSTMENGVRIFWLSAAGVRERKRPLGECKMQKKAKWVFNLFF